MGGGITKSVRKKHLQEVLSLSAAKMKKPHKPPTILEIVFSSSDFEEIVLRNDDPMIILAKMVNAEVKKGLHRPGKLSGHYFPRCLQQARIKKF